MRNVVCLIILTSLMLLVAATFAADSIIAPGEDVRKLADGFGFTEGPAVDSNGDVYFVDDPNRKIHRWSIAEQKVLPFIEDSQHANGTYFDKSGNLIACEGGTGSIVAYDRQGHRTVIADTFDGKRFNKPNDLWIDPKGGIYFTDPVYGKDYKVVQDGEHVYYIYPDKKKVVRVANDFVRPNGLVGTPDGKRLYITDQAAGKVWKYDIREDGTLENKKLFAEVGVDGMTIDMLGNVYITAKEVFVFDSQGREIERIKVPEVPANVCFGGADGKTLFITARKGLYCIRMNVRGVH